MEVTTETRKRVSCYVPKNMTPTMEEYEGLGFTFKKADNSAEYLATLPEGWTVSGHGYWKNIIDEKGRTRGRFFYNPIDDVKKGEMTLTPRYYIGSEKIFPRVIKSAIRIVVNDANGSTIVTIGQCNMLYSGEYNKLVSTATDFLNQNFPGWENPTKYWD